MKSNFVSLHPYFKVQAGKLDAFRKLLPRFMDKTAKEKAMLFYEFTMSDDELFCREAYENAEGLLEHLANVTPLLAKAMRIADLTRVEVHGPAAELAKLKEPLAYLKPVWFVIQS